MVKLSETKQAGRNFQPITFKPNIEGSDGKWVKQTEGRKHGHGKWQNFEVERGSSLAHRQEFRSDKRIAHVSENYKGKNPMTRSQWRREQRRRKAKREAGEMDQDESRTNVMFRGFLRHLIGVVSVIPREFDRITKVDDNDNITEREMAAHKPVCYYIMNNGSVEEQNAFFERPNDTMKSHFIPLLITGKVKNILVNKILVDCGATMNLMPYRMLEKIGKYDTDAKPHNMVLTNYEGKLGSTLGAIQVELTVGTVTRSTMFMIVETKANCNMLLGREWIHGVGAVPSSMHQRIIIRRPDGIAENIEADQGYFRTHINHVDRSQFDKHLATIAPCDSAEFAFTHDDNAYCSLSLHPHYGFRWDREVVGEDNLCYLGVAGIDLTGWGSEFSDDD
ncbi:hypothetical protein KIW84_031635 [Lathyrus oleraceus]|uniref:Uncharacterized protein n=1 Tax=Pisum sativum TaxID=3888 RepID=A0A9D4XTK3_PEA|nr:hypothetical protein KIW84_031635 [Pisum sativum]